MLQDSVGTITDACRAAARLLRGNSLSAGLHGARSADQAVEVWRWASRCLQRPNALGPKLYREAVQDALDDVIAALQRPAPGIVAASGREPGSTPQSASRRAPNKKGAKRPPAPPPLAPADAAAAETAADIAAQELLQEEVRIWSRHHVTACKKHGDCQRPRRCAYAQVCTTSTVANSQDALIGTVWAGACRSKSPFAENNT